MTTDLEGFPRRLKVLMGAEDLSTRQLSERTEKKVSHSAIAQWISGENRATLEQVTHVARVFGWDPHELLYGRGSADIVDRLADMDAALRQVRRAAVALVQAVPGLDLEPTGAAKVAGPKPHPSRASRAAGGD